MHPSLTVCAFAGRSATVTATAIWRISEHSWQLQEKKAAGISLLRRMGVFSMDGYVAKLEEICDLADEFDALTMVDDSHALGFMGEHGRGTPEHCHVMGRIDIITGTFGKAMGGASGGFTAARQPIVDLLRQHSRPYLFSNTLAPAICAATIRTIELVGRIHRAS